MRIEMPSLKTGRIALGMSHKQLADWLCISEGTIKRYENGERRMPKSLMWRFIRFYNESKEWGAIRMSTYLKMVCQQDRLHSTGLADGPIDRQYNRDRFLALIGARKEIKALVVKLGTQWNNVAYMEYLGDVLDHIAEHSDCTLSLENGYGEVIS